VGASEGTHEKVSLLKRKGVLAALGAVFTFIVAPIVVTVMLRATSHHPAPSLQVDAFRVSEAIPHRAAAEGPQGRPTGKLDVVDITLSNTGDRRSVLTSVDFRIEGVLEPPGCGSTAYSTPIEGSYNVLLPFLGHKGQVLEQSLPREIPADHIDRFLLRFGVNPLTYDTTVGFWKLAGSIHHDRAATPLPLGTVVVSSPDSTDRLLHSCLLYGDNRARIRRFFRGATIAPALLRVVGAS
jgi:hypothetical protein